MRKPRAAVISIAKISVLYSSLSPREERVGVRGEREIILATIMCQRRSE
jgi:hypothetical protein